MSFCGVRHILRQKQADHWSACPKYKPIRGDFSPRIIHTTLRRDRRTVAMVKRVAVVALAGRRTAGYRAVPERADCETRHRKPAQRDGHTGYGYHTKVAEGAQVSAL